MGTKSKLALAGGFVGMVAMAAAAFGQSSPGSGTQTAPASPSDRRAAAAQNREERVCGRVGTRHRAARLVHNEAKIKAPNGFAYITIDQGDITGIDHGSKKITIKRRDGESVSATATDQTKVCMGGKPVSFDALKVGDHARLLQVRSERFTGLRRIAAMTPGSENSNPPASPAEFSGDELGDPTGGVI